MNSNQENPNEGKNTMLRNTAKIVFLIAVAVIIYLLARSCNDSRSKLEDTRTSMVRERDSLVSEIRKIQEHFVNLQNEKEALNQTLEKESEANKQLLSDKAVNSRQIKSSNTKITEQKEKINSLSGKNDSLLAEIEALQVKMDELDRKIAGKDKETDNLNSDIDNLSKTIKDKDEKINTANEEMILLMKTDSVKMMPRFITAAEILGGWGMSGTDLPFSRWITGGNVTFGMEFNKRFLAGIGTGAHIFNGGTLMPIFLEFRYGFPMRNFTPYIYSKGGPLINFSGYHHSNLFLNAGIGLRHQLSDNLALNFGTGLYSHNSGVSDRDSFLTLNIGLLFTSKEKPVK